MKIELTERLLEAKIFRMPETLQVMLLLALMADEERTVDISPQMWPQTVISTQMVRLCLTELEERGYIYRSGQTATIISMPDGMSYKEEDKPRRKPAAPRAAFTKPTLADVEAYILEKGYTFHADDFVNYYESVGWVVGRTRKPMKNWKAACSTFQKNENEHKRDSYQGRRNDAVRLYAAAEASASLPSAGKLLTDIADF